MVCHGGLFSKDGVKLRQISEVHRKREPGDEGIMVEALWSDPCDMNGRHPSKRGVGVMFGPDIAAKFLDDNGLSKQLSFTLIQSFTLQRCWYAVTKSNQKVLSTKKVAEY